MSTQNPFPTEPAMRLSASQLAADYLRRLVFEGRLRPGDKIPQGEVAAALGLSRIPVREAIVALEREGVLRIEPHRGAFVTALDGFAILDHFELYGLLYGHAARRAAERASSGDMAAVRAILDRIPKGEDYRGMLSAATHFRDVIQHIGGSPRLRALLASLAGIVPGNFFEIVPGSMAIARKWLPKIVKAIEAREPDAAADGCLSMMRAHGDGVLALLTANGVVPATGPE
jgi:DNA-binding GntR family transcriptional regulator